MSKIKGLENLTKNTTYSTSNKNIPEGKEILDIPLKDIVEDKQQVRQHFNDDALKDLSASIKEHGILSPILVIKVSKGEDKSKYRVLTGERRYRACKKIKQKTIPCIVYDKAKDDDEIKAIQLIENIQRENLTAIETAKAIAQLKEKASDTNVALAKKLGVSTSVVGKNITIMELDEEMLNDIEEAKKDISFNALYKVASATKANQKKEFNKLIKSLKKENKKADEEEEEATLQEEQKRKKIKNKLSKLTIEKAWLQLQDEVKDDILAIKSYITNMKLEGLANAYKVKDKDMAKTKKNTKVKKTKKK